ncbi:DUF397 domain-containing protein [Streptomyces sp. RY43-2]|uniref:DUF397 domain-containing protein n=1 Tax=Streptomyces macrolidinus TaxID=2952607 RepID=A0ABT0Z861_9ACTN|nr:DUF397 domain-containing protein [Streptomyces macrolidinus]MCN9239949.1 DUF397 domain-containing protein [Streptomyces macrolidinus]
MSNGSLTKTAFSTAIWRKSSYSGGQGDCLELAHGIPALAPIRDSKNPTGPVIPFSRHAWHAFITHLS